MISEKGFELNLEDLMVISSMQDRNDNDELEVELLFYNKSDFITFRLITFTLETDMLVTNTKMKNRIIELKEEKIINNKLYIFYDCPKLRMIIRALEISMRDLDIELLVLRYDPNFSYGYEREVFNKFNELGRIESFETFKFLCEIGKMKSNLLNIKFNVFRIAKK